MKERNKNKVVLYHAGHYGFLSKFLVHKIKKHDDARVVILVDCSFASPETRKFLSDWNKDNGSGCEVVMYSDKIFWNYKTVDEVEHAVIGYFDKIMLELDINLKLLECIYSGYDGLNAFAAYLCTQHIKYIAVDSLGNTLNFALAEFHYDNERVKYSDTAQAYLDFLKKYDVLTARSENVSSILFIDASRTTEIKNYSNFDYLKNLNSLSPNEKKRLLKIYNLNDISLDSKGVLIPLRSYSSVKYSGIDYDPGLSPFQKLLWTYRMVVDCFYEAENTIILKAHPNYAIPKETIVTFPNSTYLGGHIPFDLLGIIDIKRLDILSIGGSSPSFSTIRSMTMLPENFFSESPQTFVMFLSHIISKALFGNNYKIYFENDRDRVIFSPFFMKLNNCDRGGFKKPLTIIVDSKKITDTRMKEMLDLLDSDSIVILCNPDVQALSYESFVTYFRITKKEHYHPENIGSFPEGFIAVLYSNSKYYSTLDNLSYSRYMSRCGINLILEPIVSWKSGKYAKKFEIALERATAGDIGHMCYLSRAYRDGRGVNQDLVKAAEWMRKAKEQNIPWADWELFDILWRINTLESLKEMIALAEPLAVSGNAEMQGRLGRAYRDGKGVEQNLKKAEEWMRKAKEQGLSWADWELFDILWRINTPESLKEMIALAEPLAVSGNAEMQGRLGRAYRDGRGVNQDLDKAVEWMQKAANKNLNWAKKELLQMMPKYEV